MSKKLKKIIPFRFRHIFGLLRRLLLHKNPAGRSAIFYAGWALLLMPLDSILSTKERAKYRKSQPPEKPIIFVCGPPRSGTTMVAQTLIKHLPVFFFTNFTSLFPNAPITASKLFGKKYEGQNNKVGSRSLYGRTRGLWAPNDALYIWDRFTGGLRNQKPGKLSESELGKLQRLLGAIEDHSGKPLLNKNNGLFTYADQIADVLPNAHFICLDRNPIYLAQSLLIASEFIHGHRSIPYGMHYPENSDTAGASDAVSAVCHTVSLHKQHIKKLQARLGPDRLTVLNYEDFCQDPSGWVRQINSKVFGKETKSQLQLDGLKPFPNANTIKIDPETFERIVESLEKEI